MGLARGAQPIRQRRSAASLDFYCRCSCSTCGRHCARGYACASPPLSHHGALSTDGALTQIELWALFATGAVVFALVAANAWIIWFRFIKHHDVEGDGGDGSDKTIVSGLVGPTR
jgi:hypothetical protein